MNYCNKRYLSYNHISSNSCQSATSNDNCTKCTCYHYYNDNYIEPSNYYTKYNSCYKKTTNCCNNCNQNSKKTSLLFELQSINNPGVVVAPNSPIIWNSVKYPQLNNSINSCFNYSNDGSIVINKNGTYMATWWIYVDGSLDVNISLTLQTLYSSTPTYSPLTTGQIYGQVVFDVYKIPFNLKILNTSDGVIQLGDTPINADLIVQQIN